MLRRGAAFYFLILILLQNVMSKDLNIKNYTVVEGLAQSQVYTIVQDLDGYLWVGTGDGLSKFDGKKFITYRRQQGLCGNIITSSFRDYNGDLWFGCYSGKLNRYDWDTKEFLNISLPDKERFIVTKIIRDSKGYLWVGTESKGIFIRVGGEWKHFQEKDGLNSNVINDMDRLDDGFVLVSFNPGIKKIRYDGITDKLEIEAIGGRGFLNKVIINDADVDQKTGDIWIAAGKEGVIRIPADGNKKGEAVPIRLKNRRSSRNIAKVIADDESRLWISSAGEGVLVADIHYPAEELKIIKSYGDEYGFDESFVLSFLNDREGNLWIGTDGLGLIEYQNLPVQFSSYDMGFDKLSIWSIYEGVDRNIWFGLEKGIAYAPLTGTGLGEVRYFSLADGGKGVQQVSRICENRRGELFYISWKNGIFKFSVKNNKHSRYIPYKGFPQKEINSFLIKNDICWFATENSGIIRYNRKTGEKRVFDFTNKDPELNKIYELFEDSKGNIWFGTYTAGVIKYDGERFQFLNKESGFPLKSAVCFAEDSSGNVWFVSYDGDLVCYDGKKAKELSFAKGLDGRPVYSVISGDSSIWVGTTNGIARYDNKDSCFIDYNTKYGFNIYETNQGAIFKDSKNNIWFGTIKGAVKVETHYNRVKNVKIPLYIDNIQVFFKDYPIPENHKYDYNKNYLTFNYQAINLANPLRVRYSFKLDGYDENWSPPFKENKVTYSNLPPGSYTFRVKVSDSNGNWGSGSADYHFEIMAPFWKTWFFYLLIIVMVVGVIFFVHRRSMAKLEKYNQELEKEVQKRVSEVSNEKEKVEYALKALRESERKFRVFTETTSSIIFIIKNGRIDYINPSGERLTGYSKKELMGFNILNIIHHGFVEEVKEYLANDEHIEYLDNLSLKIVNKAGDEKWVDIVVKTIIYDDEKVFLGTAVDITRRKRMEERLLEETERLSVTLASIADAVVTTDIDGKIVFMNAAAENISRFSNAAAVGKRLDDVFKLKDEQSRQSILSLFETSPKRRSMKSVEGEAELLGRSGESLFVEYKSSAIRDSRNKISGVVFVFRDITERKKLFDELLKTKKLESLGVLAGGIAHDFNNILTAVIGNLSLAKMKIDPENKAYQWIDLSEKSSIRAKNLTQQLLTFSKGGAPVKKNAAIDKLIEETTAFILSGSNVDCKIHFDKSLPHVNMDQGQISQVIQNLIINAQNAMPDGGTIEIDVSATELNGDSKLALEPGAYVRIKIEDSGAGISKEHIDKVFDPFYTTTKSGSGLGLSTAYSIIKNHNGSISVESAVGVGTTFTIYLPAVSDGKIEEKESIGGVFKGSGKILLMDDEELILDTASALLDFMGYNVTTAKNGEEAVRVYKDALSNDPFSAVIMDLTIPGGMGGKEAVQEILKIDPHALVVVSSGYSSDPVMSEYEKYGFKGRITKPYNLEEMGALLNDLKLV